MAGTVRGDHTDTFSDDVDTLHAISGVWGSGWNDLAATVNKNYNDGTHKDHGEHITNVWDFDNAVNMNTILNLNNDAGTALYSVGRILIEPYIGFAVGSTSYSPFILDLRPSLIGLVDMNFVFKTDTYYESECGILWWDASQKHSFIGKPHYFPESVIMMSYDESVDDKVAIYADISSGSCGIIGHGLVSDPKFYFGVGNSFAIPPAGVPFLNKNMVGALTGWGYPIDWDFVFDDAFRLYNLDSSQHIEFTADQIELTDVAIVGGRVVDFYAGSGIRLNWSNNFIEIGANGRVGYQADVPTSHLGFRFDAGGVVFTGPAGVNYRMLRPELAGCQLGQVLVNRSWEYVVADYVFGKPYAKGEVELAQGGDNYTREDTIYDPPAGKKAGLIELSLYILNDSGSTLNLNIYISNDGGSSYSLLDTIQMYDTDDADYDYYEFTVSAADGDAIKVKVQEVSGTPVDIRVSNNVTIAYNNNQHYSKAVLDLTS